MTDIDISKYVINQCVLKGTPVSNIQLQNILFITKKHMPEIISGQFETINGILVLPEVYYHYCVYGAMPIDISLDKVELSFSADDKERIDNIIETNRDASLWDLQIFKEE